MRILRSSACAALLGALALTTAAHAAAPTFTNYAGPANLVGDAGEPSIGYNPKTDATLFQAYTTTAKVTGFDGAGHATWQGVTEPTAITSLDPILWTDRDTGRSRGFGFVEMATPEDAEQAISKLNGTSVDGRTIQVERAKSPGSGGGGGRSGGGGGGRPRW